MKLRALLDIPGLRLRLLTGADALDRSIRRAYTTDLPDPSRYLEGGELVLTGLVWRRRPADSEPFVAALAAAGVAAVAAGCGGLQPPAVPGDMVAACRRHGVPLIEVPAEVSFAAVTEQVAQTLAIERGHQPGGVPGWHRRLHGAVAAGAGLDTACAVLAEETGGDCWVLSATGRVIAHAAAGGLGAGERAYLARQYLAADRLPRLVRTADGRAYSLLPTSSRPPRIAGWFLAVAGDHARWPAETRGLGVEVTTLIALERFRHDEARLLAARQAADLLRLAGADGTAPDEIASRLRVSGLAADEPVGVLVAGLDTGGIDTVSTDTGGTGTGGTGTGGAAGLAGVLEEICAPYGPRSLVTTVDDEAVAIVPTDIDRFDALVAAVRAAAEALRPGLGTGRLGVGIAAAPASAAGLRGALREARYARRLARHRTGPAAVVAADELASHALLLATVPEELRRSFRHRLLGPLLDYDRAHQTNLVETLGVFLDCGGSWNRGAARLHIHVNTLRYRIGHIERLTGRDLTTTADRVDLYLALRMS